MSAPTGLLAAQRHVMASSLTALEKSVLLVVLAHWSADSPMPYPSVERIAVWASLHRATVIRTLGNLERQRAITIVREPGRVHRYDLTAVWAGRLPVAVDDTHPSQPATRRAARPVAVGDTHPSQPATTLVAVGDTHPSQPATRMDPRNGTNDGIHVSGTRAWGWGALLTLWADATGVMHDATSHRETCERLVVTHSEADLRAAVAAAKAEGFARECGYTPAHLAREIGRYIAMARGGGRKPVRSSARARAPENPIRDEVVMPVGYAS